MPLVRPRRLAGPDDQLLALNKESQEPGKPGEQNPPRLLAGVRPRIARVGWNMQFVQWLIEHQKEVGAYTTVSTRVDNLVDSRQTFFI